MNKILVLLIAAISFISCEMVSYTTDEKIDNYISEKVSDHNLYHLPIFDTFTNVYEVATYIRENVEYIEDQVDDVWSDPQATLERGYGDCDDLTLLFMNIVYYALGEELMFSALDSDTVRAIGLGGEDIDHAMPYDGVGVYKVFNGLTVTIEVAYYYTFWEVFLK